MKSSEFHRDGDKVTASLKELGNTLVTLTGCKVYFPVSFENYKLAAFDGSDIKVLGAFIIALEDKSYGLVNVNTKMSLTPSEVNTVPINGDMYYELVFDKGSTVSDNLECLKDDVLTYYIYNYFVGKGLVPWYFTYNDLCHLFDTADEYANAKVGSNPEIIGLMMSIITRDMKNRTIPYRQVVKTLNDTVNPPVFIPISSIEFGATNTLNKLGGNYFDKGVASALVTPTESVELIESIIRS